MTKNTRNLLIGAGVAAAGVAAVTTVSYAITKKLLTIAMDRDTPELVNRNKEKLTGSPKIAAFFAEASEATERLKNSDCEEVEITGQDGTRLVGHWHHCANAKRVIVAMHGWRSSWAQDFGTVADFWHDNDCSVLYAEQRGQGESGGDYMGFGLLERYDCLDWIHWVNERTGGGLPVYLGGVSMGATTVLMTAGLELPDNVRGIIADCGFTSPHAIWKHVAEHNLHMPYTGIRAAIASDMCRKKIHMGTKDYSATDAMHHCKVPVLFIHGTDDRFVPVEMTYENYKACAAPKRLFVVPGADHGMSYLVDEKGYQAAFREFWNAFDEAKMLADVIS